MEKLRIYKLLKKVNQNNKPLHIIKLLLIVKLFY